AGAGGGLAATAVPVARYRDDDGRGICARDGATGATCRVRPSAQAGALSRNWAWHRGAKPLKPGARTVRIPRHRQEPPMLASQRALFDMPREVAYLNAAAWSPLPLATQEAARAAVARKGR